MDTTRIISVWSSYGHAFMNADDGMESCLTCGALYELKAVGPDPTHGSYMAMNGDEPVYCTGNTNMAHGYTGEREPYEGDESHACNCLLCDS